MVVSGQFLQPLRMSNCVTGQVFDRPFGKLPAATLVQKGGPGRVILGTAIGITSPSNPTIFGTSPRHGTHSIGARSRPNQHGLRHQCRRRLLSVDGRLGSGRTGGKFATECSGRSTAGGASSTQSLARWKRRYGGESTILSEAHLQSFGLSTTS